jgi:lysyl-tRNA synthetase class I
LSAYLRLLRRTRAGIALESEVILASLAGASNASEITCDALMKRLKEDHRQKICSTDSIVKQNAGPMPYDQVSGKHKSRFLSDIANRLNACDWNEAAVRKVLKQSIASSGIGENQAYAILYQIFLGCHQGPPLARVLSGKHKDLVLNKLLNTIGR